MGVTRGDTQQNCNRATGSVSLPSSRAQFVPRRLSFALVIRYAQRESECLSGAVAESDPGAKQGRPAGLSCLRVLCTPPERFIIVVASGELVLLVHVRYFFFRPSSPSSRRYPRFQPLRKNVWLLIFFPGQAVPSHRNTPRASAEASRWVGF